MNKRVNELYIAAESLKEWFVSNWPAIEAAFNHPDIQKVAKASGISITDPGPRVAKLERTLIPFRGSAVEVISKDKPKSKFSEVAEMSFLAGRAFMILMDAVDILQLTEKTMAELESLTQKINKLGAKEAPWLFDGVDDAKRNTLIVSDGKRLYRLWSTIVNAYVSEPIHSVEDLEKMLLNEAVRNAVENFKGEFPARVRRAKKSGTSSMVNWRQRTDDWDEEKDQ